MSADGSSVQLRPLGPEVTVIHSLIVCLTTLLQILNVTTGGWVIPK